MNGKGVSTEISCVNSLVKYEIGSPVTICVIRQITITDRMFRHPLIFSLFNQPIGGQR